MTAQDIADHLRHRREKSGLSLADLAALAHVSVSSLSGWEKGEYLSNAAAVLTVLEHLGVELRHTGKPQDLVGRPLTRK